MIRARTSQAPHYTRSMAAADEGDPRLPAVAVLVLVAIVGVGLLLRLHGLDRQTLTHAEVYVPRLVMPDYVSAPPPRTTLAETLLGTLHHDNHPPGYYAAMWAWTGLTGTGLFAMRLPSALAGATAIALLFCAVRRRDGNATALTAAALLALHGHHLFWSQQARMWVFLACCAVGSLVLLQALERRGRTATAIAWVLVLAAGLWLDYSFWPFVAAQLAWLSLRACEAPTAPASLDWAWLAVVASAPVLAFLQLHLGLERTGYLAHAGLVDHLTGFFLMQWLVPNPPAGEAFGPLASVALLALLAAGVLLLVAGVIAGAGRMTAEPPPSLPAVPGLARFAAAALPTLFGVWLFAQGEGRVAAVAIALPWALLALGLAARRSWPVWSRALRRLRRLGDDPAALHALFPLAILLGISLLVPSVAARSLLFVTPFALWLVVRGLAVLAKAPAARALAGAALLAAGGISVHQYSRGDAGQVDYQALAAAMAPFLRPDDAILINDAWWAQPMHYYLPPDRYRTGPYAAAAAGGAGDRVWVVVLDPKDVAAFEAVAPRLRGYARVRRSNAPGAHAVLLERPAAAAPSAR
jgi:hypothetical protein